MHNGNLMAKNIFLLFEAGLLSIRLFWAGILFTAVAELQTPTLRVFVWVFAMLIVFGVIRKIYHLVKFMKHQTIF